MADIIDLQTESIIRTIASQTDLTEENSNLRTGVEECIERNKIYRFFEEKKSKERAEEGLEPNPCFNRVCEHHVSSNQNPERFNYCAEETKCHGCLFQMITHPPNYLNYNEYMPSHREALDMLEKNGLLKGDKSEYQDIFEEYKKCKTQEERKNVVLDGVTIHQAGKALDNVLTGFIIFFKNNNQKEVLPNEIFENEKDLIVRNFQIELEKVLGVYPNIIPLEF